MLTGAWFNPKGITWNMKSGHCIPKEGGRRRRGEK